MEVTSYLSMLKLSINIWSKLLFMMNLNIRLANGNYVIIDNSS